MTKDQIERISFCKYLLTQAKVHIEKDKPLSSLGILILHDLVEIYLHVTSEVYSPGYKKPHTDILQSLTTEINKKLQERGLSPHINQSYIKRLNERRNPLKHASIFVDKDSINDLYRETEIFLNDFTPILFVISIDDISLVDLVKSEKIRTHLKDAEKFVAGSKYNYAIVSVTKAYHYLQHENLKIELGRGAHIPIGRMGQRSYAQEYATRLRSMSGKALDNAVNDVVQKIGNDINKLSGKIADLEIVATCGADYKSFLTFRLQLPHIYIPSTADTDDTLKFWNDSPQEIAKLSYEAEDVKYCLGFLLDVVFRIEGHHTA
jgi:hypothetical protein